CKCCATGSSGCLHFSCCPTYGYQISGMGNCSASCLAAGGPSNGLLSHAHKSLKMNSCWRSRAARLESDHPKLDFICRYFRISMAISAVQICVLTALALVPRNDFTLAVCFSALKNSSICHLSLYIAATVEAAKWSRLVKKTRISSLSAFQYSIRRNRTGASPFLPKEGTEMIWSLRTLPFSGTAHTSTVV